MEDELVLLQALYPECTVSRGPARSLKILYEAAAKCGKIRLRLSLDDEAAYPVKCRPKVEIERGLGADVEAQLIKRLYSECEKLDKDYCLVQIMQCFAEELNTMSVTCGVCLDEVEDDVFVTVECAHVFHRSTCFQGWIEQCKQNREGRVETEQARIRRRQRESVSESEHRQAQTKVALLEMDRERLTERRDLLTERLQSLAASAKAGPMQRKASSSKGELTEREKSDSDVSDLTEVERRLADVKAQTKANMAALSGARKTERSANQALQDVRAVLAEAAESEEIASMKAVPCPVCRSLVCYT